MFLQGAGTQRGDSPCMAAEAARGSGTHQSLCRSSQLFCRRSDASQARPATQQAGVDRSEDWPGTARGRTTARRHRLKVVPVVAGLSSSLGGSTMSSSRPLCAAELCRAAAERGSRAGTSCCSDRTSMWPAPCGFPSNNRACSCVWARMAIAAACRQPKARWAMLGCVDNDLNCSIGATDVSCCAGEPSSGGHLDGSAH